MIVARSLKEVPYVPSTVLSIGTFDGVHVAHQQIIRDVVHGARERSGRSVIVTFEPHPKEVVRRKGPDREPIDGPMPLLTTLEEKLELFSTLGVDLALVIDFTFEFSRKSFRDFYTEYVVEGIGVSEVIEGYDHGFGRDREGGPAELLALGREFGFSVVAEKEYLVERDVVSSSLIRSCLAEGNLAKANRLLGRHYSFTGVVITGDRRGRSLGFPTANVQMADPRKILPRNGVYAVSALLKGRRQRGLMSLGVLPTFFDAHPRVCEVYLYDFDEEIYGERMTVECVEWIREQRAFGSPDELVREMDRDKIEGKRIFEALQSS